MHSCVKQYYDVYIFYIIFKFNVGLYVILTVNSYVAPCLEHIEVMLPLSNLVVELALLIFFYNNIFILLLSIGTVRGYIYIWRLNIT